MIERLRAVAFRVALAQTLLLASGSAVAGSFDGQAGIASDELFRGIGQNNSLSFSLRGDYVFDSRAYLGARLLNNRSAGGVQGDLYAGYSRPIVLLGLIAARLDGGLSASVYGGDRKTAFHDPDYVDAYASFGVGPLRVSGNLAPDYYGTGAIGYRLAAQLKLPLWSGLTAAGALAWNDGEGVRRFTAIRKDDGRGEAYADYSLTLTQQLPLAFSVFGQAAGTSIDIDGSRLPTLVLGLRWQFGL